MKSSKTLGIILLLVVAAVLGVVVYLAKNKPAEPTPTTKPKIDETADWKTYRNEKYGFEIKYPKDWLLFNDRGTILDPDRPDELEAGTPIESIGLESPETEKLIEDNPYDYGRDIAIYYYDSVSEEGENKYNRYGATTLNELVNRNKLFSSQSQITFEGQNAYEVIWAGLGYTILIEKDNHLYIIRFENIKEKSKLTEIEKQILSTFKFIKKDETADWKTLTGGIYGFEVRYPKDWKVKNDGVTFYLFPATNEGGSGFDPDVFISADREPHTLVFQGIWAEIPYSAANSSRLARSENIKTNGIVFQKDYWLIRAAGQGAWLAGITFNTKHGDKHYSLSRGLTIKVNGLPDAPYSGKDVNDEKLIAKVIEAIKNSGENMILDQILSTFKFIEKTEESLSCGTSVVKDVDGNEYKTVKIGEQCWLKENLKVTKNPQGRAITRYCYDNDPKICQTDGGLYDWNKAMNGSTQEGSQGICPDGWHVPKDGEWYVLENYLKDNGQNCTVDRTGFGCANAGTNLKTGGSSGFEAVLAGYRDSAGTFRYRDKYAAIWSSTDSGRGAWHRDLLSGYLTVSRDTVGNANGFSVRCLKD